MTLGCYVPHVFKRSTLQMILSSAANCPCSLAPFISATVSGFWITKWLNWGKHFPAWLLSRKYQKRLFSHEIFFSKWVFYFHTMGFLTFQGPFLSFQWKVIGLSKIALISLIITVEFCLDLLCVTHLHFLKNSSFSSFSLIWSALPTSLCFPCWHSLNALFYLIPSLESILIICS